MFKGIFPPLTVPFAEDGSILWGKVESNLQTYLATRLSGFLVLGSNGEAVHLTDSEKYELVRVVRSCVPEDRSFIVGLTAATLIEAQSFIDGLSGMKIDAFLVSVPSYYKNKMTHTAQATFFNDVADFSNAPILLYNVPQYSGVTLPPLMVKELSTHPNIVGMKESSGNLIYLQQILDTIEGSGFEVLLGSAQILGPAKFLGIEAAIVAVACALPDLPIDVMEGRGGDARQSQLDLFRVSLTLTAEHGIAGLKKAMDLAGYWGGFCRAPLLPLEASAGRAIENVIGPFVQIAATATSISQRK
jgi:4-hydroxy-2-oxoglutarate aldolase